jgi:cytochrome c-type biogenesis protein CcmF
MIAELGHFALILAFCLTLLQAFFGLTGAHYRRTHWMALASRAVAGQFVFTVVSFGCLVYAFLQSDFSVLYVAQNSSTALPMFYKLTAAWGAHEGSLLLWSVVLSLWSIAVAATARGMPPQLLARVLGVLGVLSAGFALFILTTSSPFERLWPAAAEGADLNPLLQDPAFRIHPPMLYFGYVGMSVPFAFAVAAMLEGKLDAAWARRVRPWTVMAWVFLTLGIGIGSWWSYYEFGWGGWWVWDSVENASFMPWLVGTALIHSLAVTEKRGLFKGWTLLLSIMSFSLSLLGTFLVRSGIIESVHAFASDPSRGLFLLIFLAICIGIALVLYAWRAPQFRSDVGFAPISRESFLLLNNVLLVTATGLILLGTLYPVFLDALNAGKITVGPPYFLVAFLIPMLPLVFLLAIGMHAGWKRAQFERRKGLLAILLGVAIAVAMMLCLTVFGWKSVLAVVGIAAGLWVIASACIEPIERLRNKHSLSASTVGMCVAHMGLGLFVIGATVTDGYKSHSDMSLRPGQTVQLGDYAFKMNSLKEVAGPNYDAIESEIAISRNGVELAVVHPQKRTYRVRRNAMAEAGIDKRWSRDLIISMGEPLGDGAWSVRLYHMPLVRLIWLGALVIALGGIIVVCDRRYRQAVRETSTVAVAADTKTA